MRTSEVLPNQKVNISLTEEEILQCMDLCAIAKESLETFSPEKGRLQLEELENFRDKIDKAYQNMWEIKEIKTRKNSILQHMDFYQKAHNPKLITEINNG